MHFIDEKNEGETLKPSTSHVNKAPEETEFYSDFFYNLMYVISGITERFTAASETHSQSFLIFEELFQH